MNIAQLIQQNNKNFHPDLVSHILFNLPAKSVIRFKLLSNFWHDQISSPYFHDMYHKQAKKNQNSILFYRNFISSTKIGAENQTETEWRSFNNKTLLDNDTFISSGSLWSTGPVICHSMVCFLNTKDDDDDIQISLYCFRTKNLYVLPMDPSSGFYKGIVIGFGIAYISSIKAYKLALLFEKENYETNQGHPCFNCQVIEISSLDCNGNRNYSEWRIIEETFHDYVNNVYAPVTVENTSYWKACTYNHIISFDFENENFGTISYPKEIDFFNGSTHVMCLMDLHGKLGLVELCSKPDADDHNEDCFTMVIWNLHDQGGSNNWEKVYRISVEDTGLNSIRQLSCMYLHDEEILISSRGCLIFYNLKNNTYKILDISAIYSLVGTFHESLYI